MHVPYRLALVSVATALTAFVAAAPASGAALLMSSQPAAAHIAAPPHVSGARSTAKRHAAPSIAQPLKASRSTATAPSSPILLYSQDWNSAASKRSMTDWQQVAMTHSILVGAPGNVYGSMITQLHTWNPAVKVLVYDLGPYTIKGSAEFTALLAGHPATLLATPRAT